MISRRKNHPSKQYHTIINSIELRYVFLTPKSYRTKIKSEFLSKIRTVCAPHCGALEKRPVSPPSTSAPTQKRPQTKGRWPQRPRGFAKPRPFSFGKDDIKDHQIVTGCFLRNCILEAKNLQTAMKLRGQMQKSNFCTDKKISHSQNSFWRSVGKLKMFDFNFFSYCTFSCIRTHVNSYDIFTKTWDFDLIRG